MSSEGKTQLYRHYGADGSLLYVGVSLSTVQRLSQHRDGSGWFTEIKRIEVEDFLTRQEALRAETRAIIEEDPKYNIRKKVIKKHTQTTAEATLDETKSSLNSDNAPLVYSINNTCKMLSISRSTIYILASQGKLRLIKVGGRTLVPASEISRLLDGDQ